MPFYISTTHDSTSPTSYKHRRGRVAQVEQIRRRLGGCAAPPPQQQVWTSLLSHQEQIPAPAPATDSRTGSRNWFPHRFPQLVPTPPLDPVIPHRILELKDSWIPTHTEAPQRSRRIPIRCAHSRGIRTRNTEEWSSPTYTYTHPHTARDGWSAI